jgi:cytochrome c-type protein NapC
MGGDMAGFLVNILKSNLLYVSVAAVFFVGGIGTVLTYMTAVDYTNRLDFCALSCHEMSFPYEEYRKSKHYQNESGVRAACPDCHVVHNSWPKTFLTKLAATGELYTHLFGRMAGGVDKQKVFEEDRLKLAQDVWAHYKANDSRECRNCHSWYAMAAASQSTRAQGQHDFGRKKGMTCIDCHKGITHKPVHKLVEQQEQPSSFDMN